MVTKMFRKKIQLRDLYNNLKFCPLSKNGKGNFYNDYFYWIFKIQPTSLSRNYKILLIQHKHIYSPYVFLLNKEFLDLSLEEKRQIPHLYDSEKLRLCLYYPNMNEWKREYLYCSTIIPWIYLWLIYFEDWLYNKKWNGGGKHPDINNIKEGDKNKKKKLNKSEKAIAKINKVYEKITKRITNEKT